MIDGESAAFVMLNRGKTSTSLDLKNDGGPCQTDPARQTRRYPRRAVPPGVMTRLGLGYGDARALNPRLIYCSISGYGQSGPRVHELLPVTTSTI